MLYIFIYKLLKLIYNYCRILLNPYFSTKRFLKKELKKPKLLQQKIRVSCCCVKLLLLTFYVSKITFYFNQRLAYFTRGNKKK